ncbi:hypothetical protein D3C73_1486760 [compost metagenome]
MVERADEAVEQVRLLARGGAEVHVARVRQDLDRVLLGVGVEVAREQHLVGAGGRGDLVGERDERRGLLDARGV